MFAIDVSFPEFQAEYKKALKKHPSFKNDVKEALTSLEESPTNGDAIPGFARAVWKIRLGVRGQFGKRGGYRMIYHVEWPRKIVTPLALYFKGDTPDLSQEQIGNRLSALIRALVQSRTPEPPKPLPN